MLSAGAAIDEIAGRVRAVLIEMIALDKPLGRARTTTTACRR
jgi:hypothetical protein